MNDVANIGDYETTRAGFRWEMPERFNFGRDVIDRCAVVPAPDEDRGSVVKAYAVVGKDYEPSDALAKEIQDYCKEHTAPYNYPRRIEFISDLPKTTTGKIRRVELRQRETAEA